MKRLTIKKGSNRLSFGVNKIKYIFTHSYAKEYEYKMMFREFKNQSKESEYSKEKGERIELKINDHFINDKKWLLFEVNDTYSIIKDLKLNKDSISLKYLESILSLDVLQDTKSTLDILLASLVDEVPESLIQFTFNSMTSKQLIKILIPAINKEDFSSNEFNYSYEEIILLQLNMLQFICNQSIIEEGILILVDIPILTDNIIQALELINKAIIIVFTKIHRIKNINDICLIDYTTVDLSSDEDIYRFILMDSNLSSIEEGKNKMRTYFNNLNAEHTDIIKSIIKD